MTTEQGGRRAISPVIGVALLVVIVTVLSTTVAYLALGLSDETDPQPTVVLELERTESAAVFKLRHRSGESIDGNKTRLVGVGDEHALEGERFQAGEEIQVVPVDNEVELLWFGGNTGHTVQTFDVDTSTLPHDIPAIDQECDWVQQNIDANGDLDMGGDDAVCDVTEDVDTGGSTANVDLANGSVLVGKVDTDGDVDLDSSVVAGDVKSAGADITVTVSSDIYGDVVASPGTNIDIDGNSNVTGDVTVDGGSLSLDTVDIDGHVYADPGDVSCSNAELGPNDESCGAYSYRDPSDYDG